MNFGKWSSNVPKLGRRPLDSFTYILQVRAYKSFSLQFSTAQLMFNHWRRRAQTQSMTLLRYCHPSSRLYAVCRLPGFWAISVTMKRVINHINGWGSLRHKRWTFGWYQIYVIYLQRYTRQQIYNNSQPYLQQVLLSTRNKHHRQHH